VVKREVEALDAHRRQSEDQAEQRRAAPPSGQSQPERQRQLACQQRGGVGAHAHERGLAEIDLARVAGVDLQPDDDDAGDQHRRHHRDGADVEPAAAAANSSSDEQRQAMPAAGADQRLVPLKVVANTPAGSMLTPSRWFSSRTCRSAGSTASTA
jgi:hypothetical protein